MHNFILKVLEGYIISFLILLGVNSTNVTICTECSDVSAIVSNIAWIWIALKCLLSGKYAIAPNWHIWCVTWLGNLSSHQFQHRGKLLTKVKFKNYCFLGLGMVCVALYTCGFLPFCTLYVSHSKVMVCSKLRLNATYVGMSLAGILPAFYLSVQRPLLRYSDQISRVTTMGWCCHL